MFFRKTLYIALKKKTPPVSISVAFTAFWSEKNISNFVVASVTESFTNLFFLKVVSLRVFTSSFSALRFFWVHLIGVLLIYIFLPLKLLPDQEMKKTLELKSDSQLEYPGESSDTNRTPSWNKCSSTVLEQFILTLCNCCLSSCRYSVEINESSRLIGWMSDLPRKVSFLCVLTRVVINCF